MNKELKELKESYEVFRKKADEEIVMAADILIGLRLLMR